MKRSATIRQTIPVAERRCEHCAASVGGALKPVAGVTAVGADHEAATARVEGRASIDDLPAAVDDAGYGASV